LFVEEGHVNRITVLRGSMAEGQKLVKIQKESTIDDLYQKALDQQRLEVDVIS